MVVNGIRLVLFYPVVMFRPKYSAKYWTNAAKLFMGND